MKTLIIPTLLLLTIGHSYAQERSIGKADKIMTPYITSENDTLEVGDKIMLLEGTGTDGKFVYVRTINQYNEPSLPADSRVASQRHVIEYFKEQEGVVFLFTKGFVVNIESALRRKEIGLLK